MRRLLLWSLLLCACGETGRARVEVPVSSRGTAARPLMVGDASVTLTRADVAFGPLYFCASEIGRAELCEVAAAELLTPVVLSALDPTLRPVGVLNGTTGPIASAIFDYGISWWLTSMTSQPSSAAPEGHSAILEGTVLRAGQTLRFRVDIDARPRVRGDLTVNAQRSQHELSGDEQLTLAVDPNGWVDRLDVAALFALDTDGDGSVVIPADSTLHESVLQGMLNRTPVSFVWD